MKQQDSVTSAGKAGSGFRVLLVDDHAMIRQGLRAMLEGHADLSVIGEAADGVEAVHIASEIRPDVILMDVNMPRMNGIEATKIIKAAQPAVMVIGLSVNDSTQVREAMKGAGAAIFLPKDAAAEQLCGAIATLTYPVAARATPQSEPPSRQA